MTECIVQKNWTGNVQTAIRSNFLDATYNGRMDFADKQKLAHQNDTGLAACAIRLRAARNITGKQANVLAKECGVSKTVYSNAENGLSYPNRDVMKHLFRAYRIDFNFMINGDFAQLPGDVQEKLFPALVTANSEWDRKSNSDRPQGATRREPLKQ
jgi:transcriptional regulator with XRE-family HTH domain